MAELEPSRGTLAFEPPRFGDGQPGINPLAAPRESLRVDGVPMIWIER